MYSTASHGPAELVQSRITRTGDLTIIARVLVGDRAHDLVIALSPTRLAVVRCAEEDHPDDYAALATMVAEGDFVWAGLLYSRQRNSEASPHIETFHISELPRLVERLQELQREMAS
ncbi:hypothetical protein [Vitreimonas flagellata]|uniref:hypothetical protein n=1 Tax=Vitreimonas flagellata TaxID=2560861 RepID=UPI0010754E9A|nr:hypothetical protein [Vitreimonas flagellata]